MQAVSTLNGYRAGLWRLTRFVAVRVAELAEAADPEKVHGKKGRTTPPLTPSRKPSPEAAACGTACGDVAAGDAAWRTQRPSPKASTLMMPPRSRRKQEVCQADLSGTVCRMPVI
ncbi:hypothetical protein DIPPA_22398 [Diplonema papillatum]|nr:hypothetical protein DIPPA_22398 [Diplonema papillatum]